MIRDTIRRTVTDRDSRPAYGGGGGEMNERERRYRLHAGWVEAEVRERHQEAEAAGRLVRVWQFLPWRSPGWQALSRVASPAARARALSRWPPKPRKPRRRSRQTAVSVERNTRAPAGWVFDAARDLSEAANRLGRP